MPRERDPYAVACGRRLRQIRLALGFRYRRRFAEATDESEANLDAWENGRALVPARFVRRLKALYGVTADWLFLGEMDGLKQSLHTPLLAVVNKETAEEPEED